MLVHLNDALTIKRLSLHFSEEELGIIAVALTRGGNSSNPYFKEKCEELLHRILEDISKP